MKLIYALLVFASSAHAGTILECKKDGVPVLSVSETAYYKRAGPPSIWTTLEWADGTVSGVDTVTPATTTSHGGCIERVTSVKKGWSNAEATLTYESWTREGMFSTRCAGMWQTGAGWVLAKPNEPKVYLDCSGLANDEVIPTPTPTPDFKPCMKRLCPGQTAMQMTMPAATDIAVHGMIVFGHDVVYLSHMPMFHPPHDEQALFEAKLDANGLKAYKSAKGLVTLVPQPMSLLQLIAHPHSFTADLYEGHFERGGHVIATQITVDITKVVHAHKLGEAGSASFTFGEANFKYEVHFIKQAPDFDEIKETDLRLEAPMRATVIYHEDEDLAE